MEKSKDYSKCKSEQEFKMMWLKKHINDSEIFFCIETEETIKGFPDVMCINKKTQGTHFFEFKYTKSGKIKFQPTQPSFYKKCPSLDIKVIAYNAVTETVHSFCKEALFIEDSIYKMNEKAEVNLSLAEKKLEEYETK